MFILELVLLYKVINLAVTEIGKKTVLPAAIQDYNKKTGVYEPLPATNVCLTFAPIKNEFT